MLPVLRRNRTNPVGWDFFDVGREIDKLLGVEFGGASRSGSYPATDIAESANEFVVSAELPGLSDQTTDGSLQINDVDAVPFAVNEGRHARVPDRCQMAELDASVEELLDLNDGHKNLRRTTYRRRANPARPPPRRRLDGVDRIDQGIREFGACQSTETARIHIVRSPRAPQAVSTTGYRKMGKR